MRKTVVGSNPIPGGPAAGGWLNLEELAEVEVTSEAGGFPVDSVFTFGTGPGWRAASPGKQRIRLKFDQPQAIHRLHLQFHEPAVARAQEFTVRWSGNPDEEPLREIVRQQWNFSPDGCTTESEDYAVDLKAVAILELTIDPDRGAGRVIANLCDWRVG